MIAWSCFYYIYVSTSKCLEVVKHLKVDDELDAE